jgi:ubiquinone/menaquinone biosynthesis C-methylase UbiE
VSKILADDAAKVAAWDDSYGRRENFVFSPSDEVVRFVSRYLRRRKGLDEILDVVPGAKGMRVLDVGCGIGRSMVFGTHMGLEMWGVDLSSRAIATAQEWMERTDGANARRRAVVSDVRNLPWPDGHFDHALSDSALDSMTLEIATAGIAEVARLVKRGGYFYCNLISGVGISGDREFAGEVVVDTLHEQGTVQCYFNEAKIRRLMEPHFEILECALHLVRDAVSGNESGRWHVVMRRH